MDTASKAKGLVDKACLDMSRHATTRAFAPFFMDGEVEINTRLPTAATDGFKEIYNPDFVVSLPNQKQVAFLVLHEKGHKFLMHLIRCSPRMKQHSKIANIAMDYAVNGMIIEEILPSAQDLLERIPTALYDTKYSGWAMEDIFNDLMKEMEESGQSEGNFTDGKGQTLDEHDESSVDGMTANEVQEAATGITEALRQGQMMIGVIGGNKSLTVENALAPRVSWYDEMQEFFTESSQGRDDISFRRFNRRALALDLYQPTMTQETMEEMVLAFDVSGSMVDMIPIYAAAVQDAALAAKPEKVRVLWWDTKVTAEQVFTDYENLASNMQPVGGGGTRLGCVSEYLQEKKIVPSSLLVFTDGEVEDNVQWTIDCPTLWFVHGVLRNKFTPPSGRLIKVQN